MDTPSGLLDSVEQRLDAAVTPRELVALAREVASTARQAETAVLLLAAQWADAHPVTEDGRALGGQPGKSRGDTDEGEFDEDRGIPLVDRLSVSSFAVALGRSTTAADLLLRDVAVLRHRMPAVWRLAAAGRLEGWRARRVARLVVGAPDEVCAHLDRVLAPMVATVGERTLERLLDQALLAHDPERHEQDQLDKLAQRHVTVDRDSITADGLVDIAIRADLKDGYDFDNAVAQVAEALRAVDEAAGHEPDSLDVRRARAIGILADPEQAAELLNNPVDTRSGTSGDVGRAAPARKALRKRLQLVVHVAADGYVFGSAGWVPTAYDQTHHQSVVTQLVRDWAGRDDTHLTVLPVLDLADHRVVAGYRPGAGLARQVELARAACSFPHCSRPASGCDTDHVVPYDHDHPEAGGSTCGCNLAPRCRRHHNDKTHGGWTCTTLEDGPGCGPTRTARSSWSPHSAPTTSPHSSPRAPGGRNNE
ncbi:hypothetical protein DDE18_04010 [Nocardioides gansuensis]|uniref:HNH endonuclease n=1 Tax=Nocardioides gansuensis TaxID=2138300 RepID=A0A2T8FGE8_9ACTN|nr:HNH endonuclease signature motif containing protein [Nocardioides gansuensis]PVG84767.1 hypothetical protein DDE18_04010 [Nocardioides gansuensis]